MEPEVDNNMKKCITNALSPKRVSDPAYGKDWLIDWIRDHEGNITKSWQGWHAEHGRDVAAHRKCENALAYIVKIKTSEIETSVNICSFLFTKRKIYTNDHVADSYSFSHIFAS